MSLQSPSTHPRHGHHGPRRPGASSGPAIRIGSPRQGSNRRAKPRPLGKTLVLVLGGLLVGSALGAWTTFHASVFFKQGLDGAESPASQGGGSGDAAQVDDATAVLHSQEQRHHGQAQGKRRRPAKVQQPPEEQGAAAIAVRGGSTSTIRLSPLAPLPHSKQREKAKRSNLKHDKAPAQPQLQPATPAIPDGSSFAAPARDDEGVVVRGEPRHHWGPDPRTKHASSTQAPPPGPPPPLAKDAGQSLSMARPAGPQRREAGTGAVFQGQPRTKCYDSATMGPRDFAKEPVLLYEAGGRNIGPPSNDFGPAGCSMPCFHTSNQAFLAYADGFSCVHMGGCSPSQLPGTLKCPYQKRMMLSMESHAYYQQLIPEPAQQRAFGVEKGIEYFANHYLDSDIHAGYNDWPLVGMDAMKELSRIPSFETKEWDVVGVISNCQEGFNNRLEVMRRLEATPGLNVGFFGRCSTRGRFPGSKLDLVKKAKFTLAIENSYEPDYVTEKLFEPLWAGSIPIVAGTPGIKDFYPSNDSVVNMDDFEGSIDELAKWLRDVSHDKERFIKMHSWRVTLGTESFRALVDNSVAHSLCRMCIKIADAFQAMYDQLPVSQSTGEVFIRERNTFYFRKVPLPEAPTLEALHEAVLAAFADYTPVFNKRRQWDGVLTLHRIYNAYVTTQGEALRGGPNVYSTDDSVKSLIANVTNGNQARLEIIFV